MYVQENKEVFVVLVAFTEDVDDSDIALPCEVAEMKSKNIIDKVAFSVNKSLLRCKLLVKYLTNTKKY